MGLLDTIDPVRVTRNTDPVTSVKAVERSKYKLTRKRLEVYQFFSIVKVATIMDVEDHFHDHGSGYRSRVAELVEMGHVKDSGQTLFQNDAERVIWEFVENPVASNKPVEFKWTDEEVIKFCQWRYNDHPRCTIAEWKISRGK